MHVLCVAGIHDGYSVAIDGVGEIPLVGVRHVVVAPTGKGGFTSQKSMVWHTPLESPRGPLHELLQYPLSLRRRKSHSVPC